jgi:hypothetical protein
MPTLTVTPTVASPGQTVDVVGAGFTPKYKFALTTVDAKGVEVGITSNVNRPKRDGSFQVGINVPPMVGVAKIRAYQPSSTLVAEATITVSNTPAATVPSSPTSVSAVAGNASASVAWQKPSSDGGSPVTGYRVYRDGALVSSVAASPYSDAGLTNGTTYAFSVSAVNAIGEGAKSAAVSVSPASPIVLPFPGFAKAEAVVVAGGTVDVPPGIYKERFSLAKQGVTWNLRTGAIVDLSGFSIPVQQSGVYLKGDDIKFIGDGEITGSSASAVTGDGNRVTLTAHLHHNVEEGYVWHGSDGLMKNGSNHHNNETGAMWDSSEQGAGKANCQRLTVDGVYVHHIGMGGADASAGQGIWYDSIGQFSNGEVKNCIIHDVFYAGVFWEISQDGKLHDNLIYRCGWTPSGSGFWGAGLLVSSSRRTEVYNNTLIDNKYNGVRVLCQNRGDRPGDTVSVAVHDNIFIGNGTDIGFDSDNAAIAAVMFAPGSGNSIYKNRFASPRVFWKPQGTLTDIAKINALPGGGGNTVLTAAEVAEARSRIVA